MTARAIFGSSLLALALAAPAAGQVAEGNDSRIRLPGAVTTTEPPDVPFEPGEFLLYQVKLGVFDVGEGWLQVLPVDTVRGRRTYPLELGLDASTMFGTVKVRDLFQSWMDVHTLASLRFRKDQHEVNYKSQKSFDIFPNERRWSRTDAEKEGETLSNLPLDEVAFMYFIRTLDLEVGKEYSYNNYFKEDGNPIVLRVLRREKKEVPAGTFNTIVVQPIIQTDGLFSEGGKAEIYLSDDKERHIVYLRSEIPVVGSITLHLREIRDPSRMGTVNGTGGGN